MKKIDKYIIKIFLQPFFSGILLFLIILLSSDYIEKFRWYLRNKIPIHTILKLYLFKIPPYLNMILPVAVLFATLYTFGYLSKNKEYIALKAAGIPLFRLSLPVLLLGLIICVSAFFSQEFLITKINREIRIYNEKNIEKRWTNSTLKTRYNIDINTTNGYTLHINKFDGKKLVMYGVSAIILDKSANVKTRYDAEIVLWKNNAWHMKNSTIRHFSDNRVIDYQEKKDMKSPFSDPPGYFTIQRKKSVETSFIRYKQYIDRLKSLGYNYTAELVSYNFKFSYPFISVIVVLLAIPFSIYMGRTTGILGTGFTMLITFLFYIYIEVFRAMGTSQKIAPLVAAWFPNVSVMIIALFGIFRKN